MFGATSLFVAETEGLTDQQLWNLIKGSMHEEQEAPEFRAAPGFPETDNLKYMFTGRLFAIHDSATVDGMQAAFIPLEHNPGSIHELLALREYADIREHLPLFCVGTELVFPGNRIYFAYLCEDAGQIVCAALPCEQVIQAGKCLGIPI